MSEGRQGSRRQVPEQVLPPSSDPAPCQSTPAAHGRSSPVPPRSFLSTGAPVVLAWKLGFNSFDPIQTDHSRWSCRRCLSFSTHPLPQRAGKCSRGPNPAGRLSPSKSCLFMSFRRCWLLRTGLPWLRRAGRRHGAALVRRTGWVPGGVWTLRQQGLAPAFSTGGQALDSWTTRAALLVSAYRV